MLLRELKSNAIWMARKNFLFDKAGNYKPSWQPADIIRANCPVLVAEFLKGRVT